MATTIIRSLTFSTTIPPSSSSSTSHLPKSHFTTKFPKPNNFKPKPISLKTQTRFKIKATEANNDAETPKPEQEQEQQQEQERGSEEKDVSELGEEIKKAMKEREKSQESSGFVSGVLEEIGRIEWPEFGKVVGTTGVVLGVIAGSSVVLLTVNAVLAEISDRVFAGRGLQDFFGS